MIDRRARDIVIDAFEAYLEGRITAFVFDDRIQGVITADPTVHEVVACAWFHYDDIKDRKVNLSKQQWDYFQRMLLLLKSDAEFVSYETKRWGWDHQLAWVVVAAFLALALHIGYSPELLVATLPLGLLSFLINQYRVKRAGNPLPRTLACTPFASYSQIRWLRRQLPDFIKRPYPTELRPQPVRGRIEEIVCMAAGLPVWIILSPIALFLQGLPTSESEIVTLTLP